MENNISRAENYRIAIYIRLSKEDDKNQKESNSITVQRMLLHQFISEHFSGYKIYEFCDDGYSGTNFSRPGMQKLLEKAKAAELDCIVVKDFSRFARDYIELGAYLEQIFPLMGVRFISVNDHYDSRDYAGSTAGITVHFKNLLYDLYSKDLSQKVRTSLAVKKERGQYVSANSPFGYEKDKKERHMLVIADDEAAVVRKIFRMFVNGVKVAEIAEWLNGNNVKTPIEFKMEKGMTTKMSKNGKYTWERSTIYHILHNEIYIGNIVQKKYKRDYVGGKNRKRPRKEWIVAGNHHPPIVEKEVFYEVQNLLRKNLPLRDRRGD